MPALTIARVSRVAVRSNDYHTCLAGAAHLLKGWNQVLGVTLVRNMDSLVTSRVCADGEEEMLLFQLVEGVLHQMASHPDLPSLLAEELASSVLGLLFTLRSRVKTVGLSAYQCKRALRALIAEILRNGSMSSSGVRTAPPRLRGLLCVALLHFLKYLLGTGRSTDGAGDGGNSALEGDVAMSGSSAADQHRQAALGVDAALEESGDLLIEVRACVCGCVCLTVCVWLWLPVALYGCLVACAQRSATPCSPCAWGVGCRPSHVMRQADQRRGCPSHCSRWQSCSSTTVEAGGCIACDTTATCSSTSTHWRRWTASRLRRPW